VTRMRLSTGIVIGAALTAMVALGACGGGGNPTSAPPTTRPAASTTTHPPNTGHVTTIPTLPPTTAASPTTTAPSSTTAPATTIPSTTAPSPTTTAPASTAGATPCKTAQLTASLKGGSGAAGTFYYQLTFQNGGTTACTLYGYPGVSYVTGSAGTQVGDPADRNATISGQAAATVVTLPAGGTAHAVLAEVDVGNYPPTTCNPIAVRGLRIYPPGQTAALFVPQATQGCQATGVHQLSVGFVVS
jgi:hypothetical protein